jgi:hypothetical protein
MQKFASTTIAISILLIFSGCSTNNQTVQQRQACAVGDQHPWCMQMAQTKPLGASPYGLESTGPTNPEMRDDIMPYPRNPALSLAGGIRL